MAKDTKADAAKVVASQLSVLRGMFRNMVLASDLPKEDVIPKGDPYKTHC